jgi:hypothetical protein
MYKYIAHFTGRYFGHLEQHPSMAVRQLLRLPSPMHVWTDQLELAFLA